MSNGWCRNRRLVGWFGGCGLNRYTKFLALFPGLFITLAQFNPIGNVLDFTKPIDKTVFSLYVFVGELIWGILAPQLALALLFNSIHEWITEAMPQLLTLLGQPMATFLALTLLLATLVYALSQVTALFFPTWQPVDLGKAFLYATLGFMYLSSGIFLVEVIELSRRSLGEEVRSLSSSSFSLILNNVSDGMPDGGFAIGDPIPIDGDQGSVSGIDIAATYVGVTARQYVFRPQLPPNLVTDYRYASPAVRADCCFKYAYDTNGFDLLTDVERSQHLGFAKFGLLVLFQALFMAPYALAESLIWLVLTTAALIIFVSLPIGFVFSVFRSTSGLLSRYVNQYIELIKETVVTGLFLGFVQAMLLQALVLPAILLFAVLFIGFLVITWRIFSALKLMSSAVNGMMSGVSAGSSLTVEQAGRATMGVGLGAGLFAAGVATGNLPLMMSGGQTASRSLQSGVRGGGAPPVSYALMSAANTARRQLLQGEGPQRQSGSPGQGENRWQETLTGGLRSDGSARRMRPALPEEPVGSRGMAGQDRERVDAGAGNGVSGATAAANGTQRPDAGPVNIAPAPQTNPTDTTMASVDRARRFVRYARRAQTETEEVGKRYGPAGARVAAIATGSPNGRRDINVGMQALAGKIDKYSQAGMSPDEIVEAFRSGKPYDELAGWLPGNSPFRQRENFDALADMMLAPERRVNYSDVVRAAAKGARHNPRSVADGAAAELGMPASDGFGSFAGLVTSMGSAARSVGADQVASSATGQSYLERAAHHLETGDRDEAERELAASPQAHPQAVTDLLNTLEVANEMLANEVIGSSDWHVPQTVAFRAGDHEGYASYQASIQKAGSTVPDRAARVGAGTGPVAGESQAGAGGNSQQAVKTAAGPSALPAPTPDQRSRLYDDDQAAPASPGQGTRSLPAGGRPGQDELPAGKSPGAGPSAPAAPPDEGTLRLDGNQDRPSERLAGN
jgi:hypothetical protein